MNFNGTRLYSLLLICFATPMGMFAQSNHAANAALPKTQNKPFVFVENSGQITDQNNKFRQDIQYKISSGGVNVFIGDGQLHYQFYNIKDASKSTQKAQVDGYRVDVELVGANKKARVSTEEPQAYFENYRNIKYGNQGITAHSFGKITYTNIYPNIDWVLYVKDNKLEYDFVVHPGGNAKNIKIRYKGADNVAEQANGSIMITSPMGTINENKPYAYEAGTNNPITSAFRLKNNTLSFDVPQKGNTIVIDPSIYWSTYFGGSNGETGEGISTDGANNIYLTGYTYSTSNIATTGAYSTSYTGGPWDIYLVKFNANGAIKWGTYFGGSDNDYGNSTYCDPFGNVYMTGVTASTSGIATTGAYRTSNSGGNGDVFVTKFDSSGSLKWSTYYGGSNREEAFIITGDAAGSVYVAGYTTSDTGIATTGTYKTTLSGLSDGFVVKFDSTGSRIWGSYFGGSAGGSSLFNAENGTGLACDQSGNLYMTGIIYSNSGIATTGAFQTSYGGNGDGYLAKFNATNGTLKWSTYYGGSNLDQGLALVCDPYGNIFLSGNTSSSGMATTNAFKTTLSGFQDGYLAKFNSAGNRLWSTYFGGNGIESVNNRAGYDVNDCVYITGLTNSNSNIATTGSYQTTFAGGGNDAYVAKFYTFGQRMWSTYFGGNGNESTAFTTISADNSVYLTGTTSSTTGIATTGSYKSTNSGNGDAFIAKFNADTTVTITQPYTDTFLCPGTTWTVAYKVNYTFQTGNTFTVQLSDASGNFSSPTNIGSTSATTSGTISCTIPLSASVGTGYRIRIVASAPSFTSPDDGYNIQIGTTTPAPNASSNTPVCVGDTLKLFGNAPVSPASYSWSGPGGFTSTAQNPIITPVATGNAGTYTVTISHYNCGTNSSTTTVVVNNTFPTSIIDSSNTPICVGDVLHLYASSTTPGVTYSWSGPSGFSSSLQNPTIASAPVSASGTYYVNVEYNACKIKDSVYAEVDPMVTPNISITADAGDTLCANTDATFSSSTLFGGTSPGYQWYINSLGMIGALSDVWGSPYLSTGDTIYCILTSNARCITKTTDTSNKIVMTIEPVEPPTAYIYADPGTNVAPGTLVTFHAIVTNGGSTPTYQWRLNGVDIPGATTATYSSSSFTNHDVISVEVHSSSPCATPDSTLSNILSMTLGISELGQGTDITLYPNPNTGSFIIKGSFNSIQEKTATIDIYNLVGQLIYTSTANIYNGEMQQQVHLDANMPNGMYMVRIKAGEQNNLIRFILGR